MDGLELLQHALVEDLDSHAVIAAQVTLDGRSHRPQPHVARLDQGGRGVVGSHVDQRACVNVRVRGQSRVNADEVAELLDMCHQRGVAGVVVIRGLLQRLGLEGRPFGLDPRPVLRGAEALADLHV